MTTLDEIVAQFREGLTEREKEILDQRYGLDADTSDLPTVTQEQIREAQDRALAKLRSRR